MSKTLSGRPTCVPIAACQSGAPADQVESLAAENTLEQPRPAALPLLVTEAPRLPLARRRIASNLGEPAGMFLWEREFLLGLAVDVLEGFVENHESVENDHEEDE